ncbi:MAG: serine acetyltransferase [Nitrospira sp.]|nr:serine acetyltransferase [bacterium]MBL7047960.1 serine acetyltransferase [Nitrospira sp.]
MVSAEIADWSREEVALFRYDPSRQLLRTIRAYARLSKEKDILSNLRRKLVVLIYRFWSVITGADIPLGTEIGGGLLIPHPNGIVMHPDAVIGPNCLIFQGVTIGTGGKLPGLPVIGGHVDIGSGAKILGGVTIGDHAKIGANAVVLCDVPGGATAVGVPASILDISE